MGWENLDQYCADTARNVAEQVAAGERDPKGMKKRKTELTSLTGQAASTLTEWGPYAFFLFLSSQKKSGKPVAATLFNHSRTLVNKHVHTIASGKNGDRAVLEAIAELGKDFQKVLLAKRLLGQFLTYVRYHAKALDLLTPSR